MGNECFKLDFDREKRLGFKEAIFCREKSVDQINAILDMAGQERTALLLTHLTYERFSSLSQEHQNNINFDLVSETGFFQHTKKSLQKKLVAIVSGGTSDERVACEGIRTLEFHGIEPTKIADVGVAGIWRLLDRLDQIKDHPIVIAIAGMDAALPTVLGGLFPGALIAVPTSVGYGVASDGETALRAILASCAPGVTVCNIDNGYGASMAAVRILQASKVICSKS